MKTDKHDTKGDGVPSADHKEGWGQMLELEATPEQQRKVLWKLDMVYVLLPTHRLDDLELTGQIDTHDGCLLHDAVHGQVCAEPGNTIQFARRPCMYALL